MEPPYSRKLELRYCCVDRISTELLLLHLEQAGGTHVIVEIRIEGH